MKYLLFLPILIPLFAACYIYLHPFADARERDQFTLAAVGLNSLLVLLLILLRPTGTVTVLHLYYDITIALKLDGLGVVFLALIGFLWPLATSYAFEYMEHEHELPRFFAFYVACYGITAGVALSANLVTMYFFYEMLTMATVPLVAHEWDRRATAAGRKYMIYSIGGAAASFVGIVILYRYGAISDYVYGGVLTAESADRNILLLGYMLTFIGFGVKAAIFPLHGWLPTAGVAPTPVTALLHAVAVVKSGVFASIRSTFYSFGPEFLAGSWAQTATMIIAAVTIVYGSSMALREQHMKRRLAYSTVSNLSYILFGMTLLTSAGLTAALSHMLFHGIMKITLFFCAGTILCKTEREYTTQMEGLGQKMPLTWATFTLAGLALTGAPLLPGFISKMNLLTAAVEQGSATAMLGIAALMISALLTGAYLLPLAVRAFVPRKGAELVFTEKDRDPGLRMLVPFAILCLAMVIFGIHSAPLMHALEALVTGA